MARKRDWARLTRALTRGWRDRSSWNHVLLVERDSVIPYRMGKGEHWAFPRFRFSDPRSSPFYFSLFDRFPRFSMLALAPMAAVWTKWCLKWCPVGDLLVYFGVQVETNSPGEVHVHLHSDLFVNFFFGGFYFYFILFLFFDLYFSSFPELRSSPASEMQISKLFKIHLMD